jgi:hypothetical protein
LITKGDTLSNLQLSYRKEEGEERRRGRGEEGGREGERGRGGRENKMDEEERERGRGGRGASILNTNKSLKIYGSAIIRKDRAGVMCNKSFKSLK